MTVQGCYRVLRNVSIPALVLVSAFGCSGGDKAPTDPDGDLVTEERKMWDVWFDTDVGMTTALYSPLVLDLNGDDRPGITGRNILGDGRVDDPVLFDMDPTFISFQYKCELERATGGQVGKCHPEATAGYWVDSDGDTASTNPPAGVQKGFSGYRYLSEAGDLLGEIKGDGLYHFGEQEPRELTEWLAPEGGDGFLVWDYDGDGQIVSSKELFGTVGLNGETFFNGFEKLAHYFDVNGDGRVEGDELEGLQVWVDRNGDGVVQPGELKSLEELGIVSFDVRSYNRGTMEGSYRVVVGR